MKEKQNIAEAKQAPSHVKRIGSDPANDYDDFCHVQLVSNTQDALMMYSPEEKRQFVREVFKGDLDLILKPQIQAVLLTYESKMDSNGNRYFAFRYTDTLTGVVVEGLVDSEGSILGACNMMNGGGGYYWTQKQMGKKDFKAKCGTWPFAGFIETEIIEFIRDRLAKGMARILSR